jgi:hypothetical protein
VENCDSDNTILPAVIFVSGKVFSEIEVWDADVYNGVIEYDGIGEEKEERETIDDNMPGLEDCALDNTIIPAVNLVSSKVFWKSK